MCLLAECNDDAANVIAELNGETPPFTVTGGNCPAAPNGAGTPIFLRVTTATDAPAVPNPTNPVTCDALCETGKQ